MELSKRHIELARATAAGYWSRIKHQVVVIDQDDLQQVALLSMWEHLTSGGLDDGGMLVVLMRRRMIDYVRATQHTIRSNKKTMDKKYRATPRSLDEAVSAGSALTYADVLVDPSASDIFERIEERELIRQIFRSYRGPRRHAEAAWLRLHGFTGPAIGEALGVSESRVTQMCNLFLDGVREQQRPHEA